VHRPPAAGEIVEPSAVWEDVGGGAAVPAVELARLGAEAHLFTALGTDEAASRARARLGELGVIVHAQPRDEPQPRALTHLDDAGERTITVRHAWLSPAGPLALDGGDGAYFVSGDAAALRAARAARVLVAATRGREALRGSGVPLDAAVGSGRDPAEALEAAALDPPPAALLRTAGAAGGAWERGNVAGRWAAVPPAGPVLDAYGCGDCFAAALTLALAEGRPWGAAVAFAAERGAAALTRAGL
jgi:ribokinase